MIQRRFAKKHSKTLAVAAAALALHGCGSEERGGGGVEGELLVGTINSDDGNLESMYYLHVPEGAGEDPELVFTKNPYLGAGTHLRVWGDRVGSKLRVTRHEVIDDDPEFGMLQQTLIGSAKKPLTAAIAIVDFGGGSPNLTVEQANTRMFSTTTTTEGKSMSLKFFYAENSYGIMDVSGEAFPAIPFSMTGCDYNGVSKAVNAALGKSFDKYVYYFGTKASACAWSGLGGGNSAWLNGSIGCTVLMQEYGHAVALPHSSTMTCGSGTTAASFADDPSTCTHNEYGGRHSPMGSACYGMTGWERWREGWLQGCNGVRVKASGSYTIYPLELPCSGAQVLQVPMAHTRKAPDGLNVTLSHYYLELRGPYGIDTPLKPQVLLYAGNEEPASGKQISDARAWALDQNKGDTSANGWGLTIGQAFTDPAGGVSITVESADATSAVINVSITATTVPNAMGDSTCIDKSMFTPGTSECAPTTARPDGSVAPGGAAGMSSTGGSGGRGGAGGTAGMAGNAGRGGGGGQGGRGGSGGVAGNAGNAGNAGAGGAAGANNAGNAGTAGGGGAPNGGSSGATSQSGSAGMMVGISGSSGATGVGGSFTGGAPPINTGGVPPSTGGTATGGAPPPVSGVQPPLDAGCACKVGPARPGGSPWAFAALGLSLSHWLARRKRRAEQRRVRDPARHS